jgi:hypothetical protein
MPARILYVGQSVNITCNNGASRYLPVQSYTNDVTRPVEDILSFGQLGSLQRVQTNVSTTKTEIKSYLPFASGSGLVSDPSRVNYVDAEFLGQLTGESLAGLVSIVTVSPNGFIMSGILTSFGCDIANGGFAMADFSFAGVGEPFYSIAPTGTSYQTQSTMPATFTPVIASHVSGELISGCANSFKFMLDIPTEQVSCLGGNITGNQSQVASSFLMVAKPPFKCSVTVEGTAVNVPTSSQSQNQYIVGLLGITLPAAIVTSHSINNSVGSVGANFSYTVEDVNAIFADVANTYSY